MGTTQVSHVSHNRYFTSLAIQFYEDIEQYRLIGRVTVANRQVLQAWIKRLEIIVEGNYSHMLLPIQWEVVDQNYCGSSQIIEIQYQSFHLTLLQEVQARAPQFKYFDESQLWYLIWALVQVSQQCRKHRLRVGDINPKNIFMNQEGHIKILTSFSLPVKLQPYYQYNPKEVYFAPEELVGLVKGQMYNESDPILSQSFSIGMTILSIIFLKPFFAIYNDKYQIDMKVIEQHLEKMPSLLYHSSETNSKISYSPAFQEVVKQLLKEKPEQRIGFPQIYQELTMHINQIGQLKPFYFPFLKPIPQFQTTNKNSSASKSIINLRSKRKKPIKNENQYLSLNSKKDKLKSKVQIQKIYQSEMPKINQFQIPNTNSMDISVSVQSYNNREQLLRRIQKTLEQSRRLFPQ